MPDIKQVDSETEIKRLHLRIKDLEEKIKTLEMERDKFEKKYRRLKKGR